METVVLLHASAGSARQWDALAERLRPHFNVHAIDLHGHGQQPAWPAGRPLSLRDEASLVFPVLERSRHAHLIGHSYGAVIAMYIASQAPALVRSLAVYEPVLFSLLAEQEPLGAAIREALAVFDEIGSLMARDRCHEAARAFIDYWAGAGAWRHLDPARQSLVVARMASVCQQFGIVRHESPSYEQLRQSTMPMLCLAGSRTTAASASIATLLRSRLAAAEHQILSDMGHMGPVTHAPLVNERLTCFLRRRGQTASAAGR